MTPLISFECIIQKRVANRYINKNLSNTATDERAEKLLRQKRDLILKTLLTEDLNSDDEEKDNLGIEEVDFICS